MAEPTKLCLINVEYNLFSEDNYVKKGQNYINVALSETKCDHGDEKS